MIAQPSALEASVLVLNKLFMAVHIVSVRRAFILLCKEVAEVVTLEDGQFATYDFETWREVSEYRAKNFRQEDDDWVRTASSEIQVPRVVRLLHNAGSAASASRAALAARIASRRRRSSAIRSGAWVRGGDVMRKIRSSGGTWGDARTILKATTHGLNQLNMVRDAHPNARLVFSEATAGQTDSEAGGLKVYLWGAQGFVPYRQASGAAVETTEDGVELREDGGSELREDDFDELREVPD